MTIVEAVNEARRLRCWFRRRSWDGHLQAYIVWLEIWAKRWTSDGPPSRLLLTLDDLISDDWEVDLLEMLRWMCREYEDVDSETRDAARALLARIDGGTK